MTVCGVPAALSVIVTLPVRPPVAIGVKVTMITQVPAGETVPPLTQVVPEAKAKSPLIVTVERLSGAVPELVRVTVFGPVHRHKEIVSRVASQLPP